MGQKLIQLYEFTKAQGGSTAQMRLAMRTLVPANKAGEVPDSPEMIAKVRAAVQAVTGKDAPNV